MSGKSYEIGYGKPPIHTRFPKGRSGNPAGPAKKVTRLDLVLRAELDAPVKLKIDGKSRSVTRREAIARRLFEKVAREECGSG